MSHYLNKGCVVKQLSIEVCVNVGICVCMCVCVCVCKKRDGGKEGRDEERRKGGRERERIQNKENLLNVLIPYPISPSPYILLQNLSIVTTDTTCTHQSVKAGVLTLKGLGFVHNAPIQAITKTSTHSLKPSYLTRLP